MLASAPGRANVPMILLPNQPAAAPMLIQRMAIPRLMDWYRAASGHQGTRLIRHLHPDRLRAHKSIKMNVAAIQFDGSLAGRVASSSTDGPGTDDYTLDATSSLSATLMSQVGPRQSLRRCRLQIPSAPADLARQGRRFRMLEPLRPQHRQHAAIERGVDLSVAVGPLRQRERARETGIRALAGVVDVAADREPIAAHGDVDFVLLDAGRSALNKNPPSVSRS